MTTTATTRVVPEAPALRGMIEAVERGIRQYCSKLDAAKHAPTQATERQSTEGGHNHRSDERFHATSFWPNSLAKY